MSALLAQTPQGQKSTGIPDGGTREVLVSIFIPSLPGMPFTATVDTEWVRFLSDGTRTALTNHRMVARDNMGRIFQERRALVPEGVLESVVTQTEITDPVSQDEYICVPREHVCQVEVFHPVSRPSAKKADSPEEVALGTRLISGVETIGTRVNGMIPVGAIGNGSPILTKMEYWYAGRLGLNVLSIREDPRFGTQKFELSNIVMSEPDAQLFAPPPESKILDLRNPSEIRKPQ